MKVRFLQTFFTFALLLAVGMVYAQPANDDCANALPITLAADAASCVTVEGSTVGGTGSAAPASVCSNSWFGDDIWFSLTTPATFEKEAIIIKAEFGNQSGDVQAIGMAIYASCGASELPISCFSSEDPTMDQLLAYTGTLNPDQTYYIRVWSGGSPNDNSGTVRLCAYYEDGQADNIVWEETFDGGLGDWISLAINGTNDTAQWIHTTEPSRGAFGSYTITSPTSNNGWALYDADYAVSGGDPMAPITGPPYPNWEAELISPIIDMSAQEKEVSLKFWQFERKLNGSAFFQVSTDGGFTWSDRVEVNEDVEPNASTPSPSIKRYFLPGLAGEDSVRVKFVFDGDFYAWLIDDVRFIETELNNLRVQNNFYAIAPNAITPARMVEPIYFLADIYNAGSATQTGVNLNVTVTEASGTVASFTTDLAYGDLTADSLAENQPFLTSFMPQKDLVTDYTLTYSLSSDSTDFDPSDNSVSYTFSTSDDLFAKDRGATRNLRPADALWADAEPHSWSIGNYYRITEDVDINGDPLLAQSATIGITNPQDHAGKDLIVWLYKWTDTNADEIVQRDLAAGELETVGFNTYTLTGSEAAPFLLTLPLLDFNSADPNPPAAPLEKDNDYLVVLQYNTAADDDNLLVEASEADNYSAMNFATGLTTEISTRYTHVLGIGNQDYYRMIPTNDLATTNFGHDLVPQIHLNVSSVITTVKELPAENLTKIFPVPSNNVVNVDIELVNTADKVSFKVFDMSGRLVSTRELSNVQQERVVFDVNSYAVGTYLLQIITEDGYRTSKFVVQR